MKRTIVLGALALMVLMALPAVANAGGWATTVSPSGASPHSGYAQTTRKCAVCHAVHEAETSTNSANGEILLRTTVANACDYCHVGGPFSATQVYNSQPAKYAADIGNEHSIGSAVTTIPDSGDVAGEANPANDYTITGGLKCTTCHAVHGALTIGAGVNILKQNPNPSTVATANSDTTFCADCHTNNLVRAHDLQGGPDQVSHIMTSSVSATLSVAVSTDCYDCHVGGSGTAGDNYPHYTTGSYFLTATVMATGTVKPDVLDGVCLDCHPTSLVGTKF